MPRVIVVEEGMREGMQIEGVDITTEQKIALLDALSATGLQHIVVGSFVSPRWVPQMSHIEDVIAGFSPVEGVTYTALVLNARGAERREEFVPPLTVPRQTGRTSVHLCDVFVKRNTAKSKDDEIAVWPGAIEAAVRRGATDAWVAINAAWGSNWLGEFGEDERLDLLTRQMDAWQAHGIQPTKVWIGDPMSWNTPRAVEGTLTRVRESFPWVRDIHLHLHNGRGMAPLSAYAAMRALGPDHTLWIDTSIGGMGGCPYCGNGRATRMIPTEDFVHLLEAEGYETGIDLMALIEAAHLAESVVGHELYGHVSKAGPRPAGRALYDMDMPLIETVEEAQHFRLGPSIYDGCMRPWKVPVRSADRDAVEQAWPTATQINGAQGGGGGA
jgi:hydroxymethylglutaryl-CoA lyase